MHIFGYTYSRDDFGRMVITPTISDRSGHTADSMIDGVRIVMGKSLRNYDVSKSKLTKYICRDWNCSEKRYAVVVEKDGRYILNYTDEIYQPKKDEKVLGVHESTTTLYPFMLNLLDDVMEKVNDVYNLYMALVTRNEVDEDEYEESQGMELLGAVLTMHGQRKNHWAN